MVKGFMRVDIKAKFSSLSNQIYQQERPMESRPRRRPSHFTLGPSFGQSSLYMACRLQQASKMPPNFGICLFIFIPL